jgi:predicted negative regulator of RcsB-dependent stress response
MAIDFDCPHCGTHYRLKDEVGGKTATCKNPNCRKVIPIPKAQSNGKPVTQADLDAIAAAAFSGESTKAQGVQETITVTCSGCDHTWPVDAAKEGKNVLCPECRRPNRVPLRQKLEKADWRTGAGPTLAKKETGLDREGAFGTAHMGGISDTTAREIVKSRVAEEEPEERRKKWLKRGAIALPVIAVLGIGGYFLFKGRKESQQEARMEQAVAELKNGTNDPRFHALILRASGEHKIHSSSGKKDTDAALQDLKLARNDLNRPAPAKASDTDKNGILAAIAITMGDLLGTTAQVDKGERLKKEELVTELRHTLQAITDPELAADVLRALTRKFAEKGQPTAAEDVARQLTGNNMNPSDMVGQIGLELLRLSPDTYRPQAEDILKRAGGEAPAVQALRLALGQQPPAPKNPVPAPKNPPPASKNPADKKGAESGPSFIAMAEAEALKGNVTAASQAAGRAGQSEDRVKALAAAAQAIIDTKPTEAAGLLDAAVTQAKAGTPSTWVVVRLCRLLAKAGKFEAAESLMPGLPDEPARSWARLEILRGRLATTTGKADDSWLTPVGDPTKSPAAAKAHEEIARHNASVGAGDYQATVKTWPSGTVQPFGTAGLVLGRLDRDRR